VLSKCTYLGFVCSVFSDNDHDLYDHNAFRIDSSVCQISLRIFAKVLTHTFSIIELVYYFMTTIVGACSIGMNNGREGLQKWLNQVILRKVNALGVAVYTSS
jgi:hypothetical protein